MQFKGIIQTAAVLALSAVATTASAGYQVLDGWQMVTSGGTTTNIGRLTLSSGSSTVEQQVNGSGQAFVGAVFKESGFIFSSEYVAETTPGINDVPVGFPPGFPGGEKLYVGFSNLTGHVTNLNPGGGFKYVFDSGSFFINGSIGGNYAAGSVVGLGGNVGSTGIIGGTNGDSTVLGLFLSLTNNFNLKDSSGNSLLPELQSGTVLFQAVTNNSIGQQSGSFGACSFNADARCLSFTANSDGQGYLTRVVPEPGTIALAGLALFGIGAVSRRNKKA